MTTDEERDWVLRQNAMLPTYPPGLYQRLRRCCICLLPKCAEQAACRATFEEWSRAKWARELERVHATRAPEGPTPNFRDGH